MDRSNTLLFPNPPLQSLQSTHRNLALTRGLALKFPRPVAPFAAVLEPTPKAFADLHAILEPGESTYVLLDHPPETTLLTAKGPLQTAQLEWPENTDPPRLPSTGPEIHPLTCANAEEMLVLTGIAFPGFFRSETCRMGPYYGIRDDAGKLIAMCGERMNINHFRELSGLCTHPDHRGKGYAQLLMARLMQYHRTAGLGTYLHTSTRKTGPIQLYLRMGFKMRGEFSLFLMERPAA